MSLENREEEEHRAAERGRRRTRGRWGGDKSVSDKLNVQRLELDGVETNENIKAVRWF